MIRKFAQEISYFTSSVTNKTYNINQNEKYLVSLRTCTKCLKQYVGQTIDNVRHHWCN